MELELTPTKRPTRMKADPAGEALFLERAAVLKRVANREFSLAMATSKFPHLQLKKSNYYHVQLLKAGKELRPKHFKKGPSPKIDLSAAGPLVDEVHLRHALGDSMRFAEFKAKLIALGKENTSLEALQKPQSVSPETIRKAKIELFTDQG